MSVIVWILFRLDFFPELGNLFKFKISENCLEFQYGFGSNTLTEIPRVCILFPEFAGKG